MAEFAKAGVGNTALGLSIGALAGELLTGQLGNIFNGIGNGKSCGCSEDHLVNRYEMGLVQENEALKSTIALRDANTYTMTEMGKLRDYVDRRFDGVNAQLCNQSVLNAQVTANIACMQGNISTLMGLTKTVIPNGNVCPGWGDVTVSVTPASTTTAGA